MATPDDVASAAHAPESSASATRVELFAGDYLLAPLDFGAPVLNEVTPLRAASYTLGPPAFDVPGWRYGYWRLHWIDAGSDVALGAPRHISNSLLPDLIAKMERWLVEKQATSFRRIGREDAAVKEYARKLVAEAGIETSDTTLLRQIIRPAFQNIESRS